MLIAVVLFKNKFSFSIVVIIRVFFLQIFVKYRRHICADNVRQGNVWISMEVMDVSLEHFYKKVHEIRGSFQEDVLSVIAFSVRSCFFVIFLAVVLCCCHAT